MGKSKSFDNSLYLEKKVEMTLNNRIIGDSLKKKLKIDLKKLIKNTWSNCN